LPYFQYFPRLWLKTGAGHAVRSLPFDLHFFARPDYSRRMKRFRSPLFLILIAIFFGVFTAPAETRETTRLREGKITKNEAQHLVIKKFPGATIKSCELKTEQGHSVWVVSLLKADKQSAKVMVDGKSGAITP
jgi:hypothetical protein